MPGGTGSLMQADIVADWIGEVAAERRMGLLIGDQFLLSGKGESPEIVKAFDGERNGGQLPPIEVVAGKNMREPETKTLYLMSGDLRSCSRCQVRHKNESLLLEQKMINYAQTEQEHA